jgi:valyl-tRNA synthetase
MDTWATSSLTPQIAGRQLEDPSLYDAVFPMALRPQAHEIIRTWAFYTIVQSVYGSGEVPWSTIMISGWGVAPQGQGKISKSKGGGPLSPLAMLERHSADALRYWAASTGTGKDAVISEEKIAAGAKLVAKLWNVGAFAERFLDGYRLKEAPSSLTAADRWILSRADRLIEQCTTALEALDYAAAKNDVEIFFWRDLADNYLEMAKSRLYGDDGAARDAARFALHEVLLIVLTLLAPFLPFVTDAVYRRLFLPGDGCTSIHSSSWPALHPHWRDQDAEEAGAALVEVASAVRRFKSERSMPLGSPLSVVRVEVPSQLVAMVRSSAEDLRSVTRAAGVEVIPGAGPGVSEIVP